MRALITGCGGFAGAHLAEHLKVGTSWRLWGTIYRPEEAEKPALDGVEILSADLRDPVATRAVVAAAQPDVIFHLAGQAFVPDAWADPWDTIETNVRIQLNLLEAVAAVARRARVVAVTSNEVYGVVPRAEQPTSEARRLAPANPYASSKAAQDLVAGQYVASHDLDVVRLRPFTHLGPGQDPRFVAASFARQIAEIEAGAREPVLSVGDLSAERDFTDVRDMVRGYRLAAERAAKGSVYNLGRGQAFAIGEIVDFLVASATVPVRVAPDPARLRPSDNPRTLCDARAAARDLGWVPEIEFRETLSSVLEDWRARVHQEVA